MRLRSRAVPAEDRAHEHAGPDPLGRLHPGSRRNAGPQPYADRALDLRPVADLTEVRPRFRKIEPDKIQAAVISPTGVRAAFAARGEIFTVPAEKGDVRDITNTADVVERDPAWSPDGKSIAYFSDESGEYALHIRDQNGMGEVRKFDIGKPATYSVDADGRIRFSGHDKLGAQMTEEVMSRLRFSRAEIDATVEAVANHMVFKDVQNMRVSRLKRFLARPTFDDELEKLWNQRAITKEPRRRPWRRGRSADSAGRGRNTWRLPAPTMPGVLA